MDPINSLNVKINLQPEVLGLKTGFRLIMLKILPKPQVLNLSYSFHKQGLILSRIKKWRKWTYQISKQTFMHESGALRMKPWGTPALTGYSCVDLPSKTTRSFLLLKKRRNKAKYLTWNSIRLLSLWSRPAGQTLSKALDISSATARVAPDLLIP